VDPVTRFARIEPTRSNSLEAGSAEFLRLALERTRRVEHRVSTREFVLVRAPGARGAGSAEENGRTPTHWTAENSGVPAYPRPLAAPPVNVDQIADTVMRQLDRRIGSWRERMGRL
jgi:hypothetical protein